MTLRLALAAAVLAALPGIAMAQCTYGKQSRITASACVEGMVFDAGTGTCVAKPSS